MTLTPLKQRPPLNVYRRGSLIPKGNPKAPTPPPAPPAPMPWDHFTTHAQINEWVQHWQDDHALTLPDQWNSWTLAQKRDWLNQNVDPS